VSLEPCETEAALYMPTQRVRRRPAPVRVEIHPSSRPTLPATVSLRRRVLLAMLPSAWLEGLRRICR
jgi:hypothetical protein